MSERATRNGIDGFLRSLTCLATCVGLILPVVAQEEKADPPALFGFPVAKEDAASAEILKAAFPPQLLAIGIGAPAQKLIENFPTAGDKSGNAEVGYHVAQNLVVKEGEATLWPYYGHRMSAFSYKGADGKAVIQEISINGLFDTTADTPFRKGGRAEVQALMSALFAAYGKPMVHRVVEEQKVHLGQVDFDQLVWKRPEGMIFLYVGGTQKSGKLAFALDLRSPARVSDRSATIQEPRWNEKPQPVGPDFSKRFQTFCDFVGFDMKK